MNEDDRKKYIEELMQPHIPLRVLQEIRQEIDSHCSDNRDRNDGLYIAMKIIDKHIKEIEG